MAEEKGGVATEEKDTKGKSKKEEVSVEDIREQKAKLQQKLARMEADLAIKEHPELEGSITTVMNFLREVQKSDAAIKAGAETNIEKERQAIQNSIAMYENKIKGLRSSLENLDKDRILSQLQGNRKDALSKLVEAVKVQSPEFTKAGTDIFSVINLLEPYRAEIGL